MTMWRVKRMEPAGEGTATVDCSAGEEARQVTLIDTDTNTIEVLQFCYRLGQTVCENLNFLGLTHTPNDWDAECNP